MAASGDGFLRSTGVSMQAVCENLIFSLVDRNESDRWSIDTHKYGRVIRGVSR